MTKPWKLKTNSSNILLVLITLILIKAEWANGEVDSLDLHNSIEENEQRVQIYVGNDDIAKYFFRSSSSNNSLILEDVNRCLDNFQLMTCMKMLLLERINNVMDILKDPQFMEKDIQFFKGLLVFRKKNDDMDNSGVSERNESLSLDEEISMKVLTMFRNRTLRVNLLPKLKIDIEPASGKQSSEFVCFKYKILTEKDDKDELEQGRKKRKGGGMSMMMMLPQLLMLGFMPFTLASLKAMVMNAVMINMMALNGAIFMTIRNLVFGPRSGDNVKYVNYGYSKDRQTQSRRPVLIIHSPAAFVKQPKVHKKPVYHPQPQEIYLSQDHYSTIDAGGIEYSGNTWHGVDNSNVYLIQENEIGHHNRRNQAIQRIEMMKPNIPFQHVNNYKLHNNFKYSNNRVSTYQRAPSLKVKQNNAKNRIFSHDQRMATPIILDENPQGSTFDTSVLHHSYSEGLQSRESEFKPSPHWDSFVWGTSPAQNETKT